MFLKVSVCPQGGGVHPTGRKPQGRRPRQRTLRILLECILVFCIQAMFDYLQYTKTRVVF